MVEYLSVYKIVSFPRYPWECIPSPPKLIKSLRIKALKPGMHSHAKHGNEGFSVSSGFRDNLAAQERGVESDISVFRHP